MKPTVDLSKLDSIRKPQTSPTALNVNGADEREQAQNKKIIESYAELLKDDERKRRRQIEAIERAEKAFNAHQEAVRRGGTLQSEILSGIREGCPPELLLLKACETIGAMTGDRIFYETARAGLVDIYGIALGKPVPLALELDAIGKRLAMLKRPELNDEPTDAKRRIQAAIEAHEVRAKKIRELLSGATDEVRNDNGK